MDYAPSLPNPDSPHRKDLNTHTPTQNRKANDEPVSSDPAYTLHQAESYQLLSMRAILEHEHCLQVQNTALLLLPCDQLVSDIPKLDDDLLSIASAERSGSTTDDSERGSLWNSSASVTSTAPSHSPSPEWKPLSPACLPEVFYGDDEEAQSSDEQIQLEPLSSRSRSSDSLSLQISTIGLEFGDDENVAVNPHEPLTDPLLDPEDHWRACMEQGQNTQDYSSKWRWSPASEFASQVPSIVVTPPTHNDNDAPMVAKTPLQDSLFRTRLFVPYCEPTANLLPCTMPRGLDLDEYSAYIGFVEVPCLEAQLEQRLWAWMNCSPWSYGFQCQPECSDCGSQAENLVDTDLDKDNEPPTPTAHCTDEAKALKEVHRENVPQIQERKCSATNLPEQIGENPFWLEDDEDELPDLNDW